MKKSLILLVTVAFFGAMGVYAESNTTTSASSVGTSSYQEATVTGSGDMMRKPPRPPRFESGAVNGSGSEMRKPPRPPKEGSGAMMGSGKLMKDEIEALKKKTQDEAKANRDAQKENLKEFRDSHSGSLMKAMSGTLTEAQKTSLKTLLDAHKTEMDSLFEQLKAAKGDDAKVKEIQASIEAARASFLSQVKTIVGDNADLAQLVDERTQVFEENKALRDENRQKRDDLKAGIENTVAKYKDAFIQKLSSKITKLSDAQIQKVLDTVNAQIAKIEANTKLSDANKTKLKAQLVALKEILEDRLNANTSDSTVTEVQSAIESLTQ